MCTIGVNLIGVRAEHQVVYLNNRLRPKQLLVVFFDMTDINREHWVDNGSC